MRRLPLLLSLLVAPLSGFAATPAAYPPAFVHVLSAPRDAAMYRARLEQARAALQGKRWAEAEPLFAGLVADYALDRETWTGLATARRELGNIDASIDAYTHAIALIGPVPGSARYWIAVQQAKAGRVDAAIATVEQMLDADHELDRPGLLADPAFAALQGNSRWKALLRNSDAGDDRVAGWRGDLALLLAEIHHLAPAYRDAPLSTSTQAAAERLRDDIPQLDDAQVYARLGQLIGTLHMGHTMLWGIGPDGVAKTGTKPVARELPVMFYAFPDGLYVVQADDAQRALLGKRLVAVDGVPAAEVFERVATATSFASPAEALWSVPVRISDLTLLQGLGIARKPGRARLTLASTDGRTQVVDVDGVAHAWRPRLPPPPSVAAPTFLAHESESHWMEDWPALATTYVQFNQVAADPDEDLAAFGLRLRRTLSTNGARNVVVDLRHNNGGNTFTYVELLRTLVAFSADDSHRVYALIGRDVYSAAANFSTDLERLAKPVFVGEATAMTGNQDGDEARVRLPWSGLSATVSGVHWQLSHPWDKRTSIAPQVPVQLTARDYFAGRDPVIDAVKSIIARDAQTTAAAQ